MFARVGVVAGPPPLQAPQNIWRVGAEILLGWEPLLGLHPYKHLKTSGSWWLGVEVRAGGSRSLSSNPTSTSKHLAPCGDGVYHFMCFSVPGGIQSWVQRSRRRDASTQRVRTLRQEYLLAMESLVEFVWEWRGVWNMYKGRTGWF